LHTYEDFVMVVYVLYQLFCAVIANLQQLSRIKLAHTACKKLTNRHYLPELNVALRTV